MVELPPEGADGCLPTPGVLRPLEIGQRRSETSRLELGESPSVAFVQVADDQRGQGWFEEKCVRPDLALPDLGRLEVAADDAAAVTELRAQMQIQYLHQTERRLEHRLPGRKPAALGGLPLPFANDRVLRQKRHPTSTTAVSKEHMWIAVSEFLAQACFPRLARLLQNDEIGVRAEDRLDRLPIPGEPVVDVPGEEAQMALIGGRSPRLAQRRAAGERREADRGGDQPESQRPASPAAAQPRDAAPAYSRLGHECSVSLLDPRIP
ncbi:MAG: hypothetical protein OEY14_05160 [Myxococcales bacterium]|nr:hypothetical protein [Myxococcales bacterium]